MNPEALAQFISQAGVFPRRLSENAVAVIYNGLKFETGLEKGVETSNAA